MTTNFIPGNTFQKDSHPRKRIMTLVTGSFLPLNWPWSMGDIGLRLMSSYLWAPDFLDGAPKPFLPAIRQKTQTTSFPMVKSLIMIQFNYLPASKNLKPDALPCQFSPDSVNEETKVILLSTCFSGTLIWDFEGVFKQAQQTEPDPAGGPPNWLFVPNSVRSRVIHWGHASKLSHHPGINWTIGLLCRHFWWPSLNKDVAECGSACHVCNQNKKSPFGSALVTFYSVSPLVSYIFGLCNWTPQF